MIALASDHAGFDYKEKIKKLLDELQLPYRDFGPTTNARTDYPDWGHMASEAVSTGQCDRGILVCGTGIGMSIVANKHNGVRAASCESVSAARLARQHNNANVLTIGERLIGWDAVADIVKMFLSASFEGGRHAERVAKIHSLTKL
ncbi:MAG: ribose 5-phosphate isomerase B [Ignavibacteriales bacterium]|nr:ribose 5-phosphate isomerase B [Ignavibacteriales bacterium]